MTIPILSGEPTGKPVIDVPMLKEVDVEALRDGLYECVHCGMCRQILPSLVKSHRFGFGCPAGARYRFDAYFSSGRTEILRGLLSGEFDFEDSPELHEIMYKCTLCGYCTISCTYAATVGQIQMEFAVGTARARAVEKGLMLPGHSLIIEGLRKEDNIFGKPKAERGFWAQDLDVKDVSEEKADVLFHAGCRASYDRDLWDTARGMVELMKGAGVDVGVARKEESCCGGRAFAIGDVWTFRDYCENNLSRVKASGASKLVTACSDCYYAFKKLYALDEQDLGVEVLHAVEYIARLAEEGRIEFKGEVPRKVTYHDPCHIGRKMFPDCLYDQPRYILGKIPGLELVEMERIRDMAWCCGAGGGVLEAYPDFSEWTAEERIEEAMSTGADSIVSACPWCERNLRDAAERMGVEMKVYDLVDIVKEALER
jgi:Fe-S oxidoreductase